MKVKILKSMPLRRSQHCTMASLAAIKALDTLELEGYYTEENSERLWETAWSTADYALVVEDADYEEAIWLATQAARRHALAIPGGNARLAYIRDGRVTPAWRIRLAQ